MSTGVVFRELRGPDAVVHVEASLEPAIRALDLTGPGRLETLLASHEGSHGRGPTAIVPLPGDGRRLHLRPMLRGGLLGRWLGARLATLRAPIRELHTTAALCSAGAPVPRPALLAGRRVGLHWEATFATIHEEDAINGLAYLAGTPSLEDRIQVARAAGRAVRALHELGLEHRDLHVGNLLVRAGEKQPEIVVIDLARSRMRSGLDAPARMRELMRLRRSVLKRALGSSVPQRMEVAFFSAYVDGDRELRTAMLARQRRELRRTRLHQLAWRHS